MRADKRAKRAKQKAKAANVARKNGGFYGLEIDKEFFNDLFQFLHDQNRSDCDEILEGLHKTMQVIDEKHVFKPEWIKRAVEKRNQLTGV